MARGEQTRPGRFSQWRLRLAVSWLEGLAAKNLWKKTRGFWEEQQGGGYREIPTLEISSEDH